MNISQMNTASIKEYLNTVNGEERLSLIQIITQDERKSVQKLAEQAIKQMVKAEKEAARLVALWQYEEGARRQGYQAIAGTDEVGRGPLAGPVVAAAVILPREAEIVGINDSKKLTHKQREALYDQIIAQAVSYAIIEVDNITIDRINILEASRLAMARSVAALDPPADFVLLDGWDNPQITLPHQAILQGDSKSISIAAASILAKVHRDRLMEQVDQVYPGYGLAGHKGYPTTEHYEALRKLGPTPIHRMSFNLKLKD